MKILCESLPNDDVELPSEDDLKVRLQLSLVNGLSERLSSEAQQEFKEFNRDDFDRRIKALSNNLLTELKLVARLKKFDKVRRGVILFQLSQGFSDRHDMNTAAGFLTGDKMNLEEIASRYECQVNGAVDKASAMMAVPLSVLHSDARCAKQSLISLFKGNKDAFDKVRPKENSKYELYFHAQQFRSVPKVSLPNTFNEETAVLITITKWTDAITFSVPGGKRDLGETPWECLVREAKEECDVDLSPDKLCVKTDLVQKPWVLRYHFQTSIDFYLIVCSSTSVAGKPTSVVRKTTTTDGNWVRGQKLINGGLQQTFK